MDAWVVEVLWVGYRIPFDCQPPLSERPLSLPAYSPQSIKGVALTQELQHLIQKGAVEPAPQSPGFYSRLFLIQKASGSWRPIIDQSALNDYVTSSHFHMETPQSVLRSIRPGDWMVSLDLQEAYLQVPVHHDSRRYLRFVVEGRTYQFRVLFRSHNRAPSLHEDYGSRFRHPSQVWGQDASLPGRLAHSGLFGARLFTVEGQAPDSMYRTWNPGQPHEIVSSSHSITSVSRHGDSVSAFHSSTYSSTGQQSSSSDRGVPVNAVSSSVPLASTSGPLVVPHTPREVAPALPQRPVGFPERPVSGLLVPSLSRGSSLVGSSGAAAGGSESLSLPAPDISFFSAASDVGWGALVCEHHASGLWSPLQTTLSINLRELLAVQYGLRALEHLLVGLSVALFCDNTTTVANFKVDLLILIKRRGK